MKQRSTFEIKMPHLLVAAIDFGTTYSGCAFSFYDEFKKDPTKSFVKNWIDPNSSMMYCKTSTCILFNEEKEFNEFGFAAEAKYLDLMLENDHHNWYFFRRFKMVLYEIQSEDQEILIEDEHGNTMPALTVFSESLKYLKQSLLDYVNASVIISMDDIKWVITVPAMWSDPAKTFMRRAAIQAEIDSDMLTIALEPEAAALFVKYLPVERKVDGNDKEVLQAFAPGSKYIVVDAGGGTVDITAHEVLEDGHVKELIKSTGGSWGGTKVDEEYMDFLKRLIGDDTTKYIDENLPSLLFEARRDFESAKHIIKPNSDKKINVRFPAKIAEIYTTLYPDKDLRAKDIVLTKNKKQMAVLFKGDKLRLATKDVEDFFTQSVKNITDHLAKLLQENDGKGISTIILVGGYGESQMLVQGIKAMFPEINTIIPKEAAWSVLRGAVIFGHDPSMISQRRSKYTYGVSVNKKFNPLEHDEKYKYEDGGEIRCRNIFSKLLEVDELVTVGVHQKEKRYRLKSCKDAGNLKLYASTSKCPQYVDEENCFFIGHILPPGHGFIPEKYLYVSIYFAETEIFFLTHQPASQKNAVCYLGE